MDKSLSLILEIEKRPGLYIGNTDLTCLNHFLNGYFFAKTESAEYECYPQWLYEDFRIYLAEKYKDNRTINWSMLITENETNGNSTDTFFKLLHEYLENHSI